MLALGGSVGFFAWPPRRPFERGHLGTRGGRGEEEEEEGGAAQHCLEQAIQVYDRNCPVLSIPLLLSADAIENWVGWVRAGWFRGAILRPAVDTFAAKRGGKQLRTPRETWGEHGIIELSTSEFKEKARHYSKRHFF